MADFLLSRREGDRVEPPALPRWRRSLPERSDLVQDVLAWGAWTLHWSVGPRAPVSTWTDADSAALVIGHPTDGASGRQTAQALSERVRNRSSAESLALDGYFLAVVLLRDEAVVISDVLGLFPVYRGDGADFVAASTALPMRGVEPDPRGLAGILAFHGTVGGRSIVPGVTRVDAGHALVATPTGAREDPTFRWPEEEDLAGRPVPEQDALLHEALSDALSFQLPSEGPVGLLLTGGRDSRTLAGLLERQGRATIARTVGHPRDHEAVLAMRVAERLGIDHAVRPLPPTAFEAGMQLHLKTDHLASGVSHAYWRGASTALTDLPELTVTGHLYDIVVGGVMRLSGRLDYGMDRPWELSRPFERRSGVPDDVLAGLRDARYRDAYGWADDTMRRDYLSSPTPQRVWRWGLRHVGRFYIGMLLQPISLESWPIVPVLDRQLLSVAARLDSTKFSNRTGQDRMIRDRYPHLAGLPHTLENAAPGAGVRASLVRRIRDRLRPPPQRPEPVSWRNDRRFVWRNTDFHNPGWTSVRQAAERHRSLLHGYVEPTVLDRYLPPPDGRLEQLDFAAQQGPKLLIALALWLDRYRE